MYLPSTILLILQRNTIVWEWNPLICCRSTEKCTRKNTQESWRPCTFVHSTVKPIYWTDFVLLQPRYPSNKHIYFLHCRNLQENSGILHEGQEPVGDLLLVDGVFVGNSGGYSGIYTEVHAYLIYSTSFCRFIEWLLVIGGRHCVTSVVLQAIQKKVQLKNFNFSK